MATQDDLYAILGVPPTATGAEIRRAYIALARQYHPDKNSGTTMLGSHFQQVARAYGILSKPDARKAYDQQMGLAPRGGSGRRRLDPSMVPPGFDATRRAQAADDDDSDLISRHPILGRCLLIGIGLAGMTAFIVLLLFLGVVSA